MDGELHVYPGVPNSGKTVEAVGDAKSQIDEGRVLIVSPTWVYDGDPWERGAWEKKRPQVAVVDLEAGAVAWALDRAQRGELREIVVDEGHLVLARARSDARWKEDVLALTEVCHIYRHTEARWRVASQTLTGLPTSLEADATALHIHRHIHAHEHWRLNRYSDYDLDGDVPSWWWERGDDPQISEIVKRREMCHSALIIDRTIAALRWRQCSCEKG